MRIGMLVETLPYLPARDGFRLYAGNMIRELSARHEIDLIALVQPDDTDKVEWARRYCASVTELPRTFVPLVARAAGVASSYLTGRCLPQRREINRHLQAGCRDRGWDVLYVEGGFAGGLVAPNQPIPSILSVHDSAVLNYREMRECATRTTERAYYRALESYERRYQRLVYRRFSRCVVVSEHDAEALRITTPGLRVEVLPNGTDTEYFHPQLVHRRAGAVVFHGNLSYRPNVAAALEFANDIFPRVRHEVPEAVFVLVGADPTDEVKALASTPGIEIRANVADLRPVLCAAELYVCPLRRGTGVKNKILEAMALGVPIVCYPESVGGLECVSGRHVSVVDSPQAFSGEVVRLLGDSERRQALRREAHDLVVNDYSWKSRAMQFERMCEEIIAEGPTRSDPGCVIQTVVPDSA